MNKPSVISSFAICFALLACLQAATAQTPKTTRPCREPVYHELDFWVGEWNVFDLTDGSRAGQSSIRKILNGCALEVDWVGVEGEHVKELFYYYKPKGQWIQVWVGDGGATKQRQLLERLPGGALRFQGEVAQMDSGSHFDRSTVIPLVDGRVHQIIETSPDGKRWELRFDAVYRK